MLHSLVLPFVSLLAGILIMIFLSNKAINYSIDLASAMNIPPLVIGVVLISFGTDLPEIVNSILSNYSGHADINIGDSMGSILSQLTLVLGLLPFFGGTIRFKRRELLVIGSCLVLSMILVYVIFEKGQFSRLDAFFLLVSLLFFTVITSHSVAIEDFEKPKKGFQSKRRMFLVFIILLCLGGVAFGSMLVINSIIKLSGMFQISEYIISFFIAGLGTSLPELFVDIAAVKKKQFNIAIGDVLGSCLVDATLSISIGQFLFPRQVSAILAEQTILYILVVSFVIILVLAITEKLNKITGLFFILLYLMSYFLFFH
jgi:cation:H+ antiporter